ncbi:MFS transporter [Chloroflexota bacterium]
MQQTSKDRPRIFYGWWIVLSCSLITFYAGGAFLYGFTAFFDPIRIHLGCGYAAVSLASSLRSIETGIGAPIIGFLVDRVGPRKLLFSGVLVAGGGFLLLSRVNSLGTFYAAFIVAAAGLSACSLSVVIPAVANWFHRKMGKATGLMTAGAGISGLMVPLVVWLIDTYSWQSAMVILGVGMWLIGIPLSLVVRNKPEQYGYLPDNEPAPNYHTSDIEQGATVAVEFTARQALRTRSFWLLSAATGLQFMVISSVITHVMPYLNSLGVSKSTAALVAMFIPLSSIAGRVGLGWMGDMLDKRHAIAFASALQALGMIFFAYASTTYLIIPFLICFGPGYGGPLPLRPALQRDYYGRKAFGAIQGLMLVFSVIGSVIGPTITGWIYDTRGSYYLPWIAYAVISALVIPLMLAIRPPSDQSLPASGAK